MSPIQCKAAVLYLPNLPLTIEDIVVDCPKSGEVRVKLFASGVCRSDASTLWGKREDCVTPYGKPIINGHEGAGVVESIGDKVTEVEVGDHVVLLWMPQCNRCTHCLNPKINTCSVAIDRGIK
jgi:S-(hydroxymethyl)glutathione dehydrogenase/alcohol dehydrogenase